MRMSISLPGFSFFNEQNNEEKENQNPNKECHPSFKEKNRILILQGGGLSQSLLDSLSRGDTHRDTQSQSLLNLLEESSLLNLLEESYSDFLFTEEKKTLNSLLKISLDACLNFSDKKLFTAFLSHHFQPSLIKRYKKLYLEKQIIQIIEKEYDNDLYQISIEEKKHQPPSFLKISLNACIKKFSEENLFSILLSRHSPPLLLQRYGELFLEKKKDELTKKIIRRRYIFNSKIIEMTLTSRFPSLFYLGFVVPSSHSPKHAFILSKFLIFFQNFSPFPLTEGYRFLEKLTILKMETLNDFIFLFFSNQSQSLSVIPSHSEEPHFLNSLEINQCIIWILILYTKAEEIISQSPQDIRRQLKLFFEIRKYLDQVKTSTKLLLPENFKQSYQELYFLMNKLDHITTFRRKPLHKGLQGSNLKKA